MEELKSFIEHNCIYRCGPDTLFPALPGKAPNAWYKWQFYLRRALLNPKLCREAAEVIASHLDLSNAQLGACEDAGVTLGYALADITGLNLFTIKKSRKAYGLLNFCEGQVLDKPVILVDDVASSTSTLKKAQTLLKAFNLPVVQAAVLVKKDVASHPENALSVPVVSVFSASDFALTYDEYKSKYGKNPSFTNWH